jgi:hypothetical protein
MALKKDTDTNTMTHLLEMGVPKTVVARKLGIARNTVYYHIRKLRREGKLSRKVI